MHRETVRLLCWPDPYVADVIMSFFKALVTPSALKMLGIYRFLDVERGHGVTVSRGRARNRRSWTAAIA
jgi:hypothetical protein